MLRKRVYAKAAKKAAKKPRVQKSVYPRSDLGPELKYLDTSAVGTFNYSGGSPGIVLLNGVAAGTANNQRIGRKVLIKSLELRIQFRQSSATTQAVRMAIVYDKQSNQAAPSIGDIFNVAATNLDPYAAKNLDNVERFIILKDELIGFGGSALLNDPSTWTQKMFLPLTLPVRFDSANGAIADITTGSLWLVFFDSNTVGASTACSYYSRIKFTDL